MGGGSQLKGQVLINIVYKIGLKAKLTTYSPWLVAHTSSVE